MQIEEYEFLDDYKSYATGISDLDFRTWRYMLRPFSVHSKEFHEYWNETKEMLKRLFHTKSDVIGITGSIRVGFDAIISSIIEPGDKFLVLTNGYWGSYVERVVKSYRGDPLVLEQDASKAIDPKAVSAFLDEHKDVKAISVMHVETDTGIWHPVKEIGKIVKKKTNALYVVDCATTFGGMEVNVDDWNADICFSGSHKCLSSPVGLAIITLNKEAWRTIEKRKEPIMGTYNDLLPWKAPKKGECEPPMPAIVIHGIRGRLDFIFRHDEKNVYKKHEICAKAFRKGLTKMGLESLAKSMNSPPCSNVVTLFKYPKGISKEKINDIMTKKYKILFGESPYREGVFQIGTINESECNHRHVLSYITCLGLTLSELGMDVDLKGAIETANNELKGIQKLGF